MIRQTDLLIKSTIELVLRDMRDNIYLLDDVFSDLLKDPYLKDIYSKDVENAKEWLKNTDIKVLLHLRQDTQDFPCITISLGDDIEDNSGATLSDQTVDSEILDPSYIKKPVSYIIKPFTPVSYDKDSGILECGDIELDTVGAGMVLVNPDTGEGHEILGLGGDNGIQIIPGTEANLNKAGVLPQYRYYKSRREASYFNQSYQIGCHVADSPEVLIWLHSIILYGLLRHRELLNSRCFTLVSFRSSGVGRNGNFPVMAENVFSRYITMSAGTQHSWLKSPKRVIEKAAVHGIKYEADVDTDQKLSDPTGDGWDTFEKQSLNRSSKKRVYTRK